MILTLAVAATIQSTTPELRAVLGQIRYQHIIPALMSRNERRLIRDDKYRTLLENTAQSTEIDGERIELKDVNLRNIENRGKLVKRALSLMHGFAEWQDLQPLLRRLHLAKMTPNEPLMNEIVRKAVDVWQLPTILSCVKEAKHTGLFLSRPSVLVNVLRGLREQVYLFNDEEKSRTSLRQARLVAQLLETSTHGSGQALSTNDPRQSPEVLATFLDLTAIYAWRYGDKTDKDGSIKTMANRLLTCIDKNPASLRTRTWEIKYVGPLDDLLDSFPLWHGLSLAQRMLGDQMPYASLAQRIIDEYRTGLEKSVKDLESCRETHEAVTSGGQAYIMWLTCLRDLEPSHPALRHGQ